MTKTLARLSQVRKTDDPDDTLDAAAVAAVESSAETHEDFFKGILSQIKRILHGDDDGNWYDDPTSIPTEVDRLIFKEDGGLVYDSEGNLILKENP